MSRNVLSLLQPVGSLKGNISKAEEELADMLAETKNKPLLFVQRFFHWGEGDLKEYDGPDVWQSELLMRMQERLESTDDIQAALKFAVASGHGVGKSALVSWLVLWFISTRPDSAIVVTANTQNQLSTKTWREVNRWLGRMLHRHWFQWQATKLYHVMKPETWYASAIPWSESNPEAFAGTHETAGVLMLFDEASAIADIIWENVEGALTTAGAIWCVFGNPTRNDGYFFRCFNDLGHRWTNYKVDSRKAKVANQGQIQQWLEDYGEDSDFFKVRVRGEFPSQAVSQFIPSDLVNESMTRRYEPTSYKHFQSSIGVDVARFGGDKSVIAVRQNNCVTRIYKYEQLDTMELASRVVDIYREHGNNAVCCVDAAGVGAGVADRLRMLGLNVIDVQSGAKAVDGRTYLNKRAELYGRFKDWLLNGGCLPKDDEILAELRVLEYQFNRKMQIQLSTKDDLRKVLDRSPDTTDAVAYTFAVDEAQRFNANTRVRRVIPTIFY